MKIAWCYKNYVFLLWSTDAVTVEVTILNATNILVGWNMSELAYSQGLSAVTVSVHPSCVTDVMLEDQYFSTSNDGITSTVFGNLCKLCIIHHVLAVNVVFNVFNKSII